MRDNQVVPKEIGEFEIVRAIGQGSIGVVYEAREKSTKAPVALKIFATWLGLTTNAYSKFQRKIESLSHTNLPGFVSVHSCGQLGLRPYYVMHYVEGPSLDRIVSRMVAALGNSKKSLAPGSNALIGSRCPDWALDCFLSDSQAVSTDPSTAQDQNRDTQKSTRVHQRFDKRRFDKIAEFFAEIADVLSWSHGQGLIHGDIKPSNLLLTPDKRACISDFGVARLLEHPGIVIGGKFAVSPVYCAPECLNATRLSPDQRADVYSLGAVLYEVLTLKRPYEGGGRRMVSQIRRDDPKSPRNIDPCIPPDLETICRKAMERKASNRYQSASQLADDLRKFASQQNISARSPGLVQRQLRWSVRHPLYMALSLGCLIILGMVTKGASDLYQWTEALYVAKSDDELYQALLFSMLGDVGEMERKVDELNVDETEAWITSLMLGQSKLVAGRIADAENDLNLVLQQRPESLAAMVLLAQAYSETARTEEQNEIELKLAKAAPTNVIDQLFLARWLSQFDLRQAAERISDIRLRTDVHSDLLATAFLALVYCEIVQDTNNRQYMSASISFYKKESVPSELSQLLQFYALKTVVEALRTSEVTVAEHYEKDMDGILVKLDSSCQDSLASARAWGWQAFTLEDSAARLQALQRSIELYKQNQAIVSADVSLALALELFVQDRIPEAEKELISLRSSGAMDLEFLSAVILAQRDGNVENAIEQLNQIPRRSGRQAILQPVGYLMLGMPDKATELYQEIRDSLPSNPTADDWQHQLLAFTTGEMSVEQILEAANQPSKSNFRSSQARFLAGLIDLAQGRRNEAKVHLEQCHKYGIFRSKEYHYARTILEKWKTTPDWPAWITSAVE